MDMNLYEQDKDFVLDHLLEGEFDYVDGADEVTENDFFQFLATKKMLQELSDTYPTPRTKEEVPRWVHISSNLSMRLHGANSFHSFPYVVRAGGMLSSFGPKMGRKVKHPETGDVTLECAGFNRKNDYDRETPCDQDTLRKFARDTDSQALFSWFNEDVIRLIKKRGGFDEEGIFLGDGSYLFVPDNEAYENSSRLLFDESGHPVNSKTVSPEVRARCQWKRCYKLVSLLHVNRSRDLFIYGGLAVLPGNAHECPTLYSMVDTFVKAAGKGVMRRLILDRGFLDGEAIGRVKKEYGVDVLIPLKKNMELYKDALGIVSLGEADFKEYKKPAANEERPDKPERPVRVRKREAKRRETMDARKKLEPPPPPDKVLVKSEVAAVEGFRSWASCPLELSLVINRETYGDGRKEIWMLLDTRKVKDGKRSREDYALRVEIEERHRQLKCFADLTGFTSRAFSLIANQVVFIALSYSLLQLYLLKKKKSRLNAKTPPRVRQEILPTASHIIIYYQNYFGFFDTAEFMEIMLSLEGEPRRKALERTRRMRSELNSTLKNPRPP
jgi:hypothetical protein